MTCLLMPRQLRIGRPGELRCAVDRRFDSAVVHVFHEEPSVRSVDVVRPVNLEVDPPLSSTNAAVGIGLDEALKGATDNACALLTSGMTKTIRCQQSEPVKTECRSL